MDYRQRIEFLKNRTLGNFNKYNERPIHRSSDSSQFMQEITGRMGIIINKTVIFPFIDLTDTSTILTVPNTPITTVAQVFTALDSLMVYNASVSVPPTKSARIA